MLARKYSLKLKSDFNQVKSKGKIYQSESFALVAYNRKDKLDPRFGFIISTKISKKASLRNRAKRSLSESVRRSLFNLKPGYDFLFLTKPCIIKKYTKDLMAEVDQAFLTHNFYQSLK